MDKFSYMSNAHSAAIEDLYEQYRKDPESVEFGWRKFFEGFEFQKADYSEGGEVSENMHKEFKVLNLINGYRTRGHLFTKTNPVRERRKYSPTLDIENFGLSEKDLEDTFQAGDEVGLGPSKLKDIIQHLEDIYCQSIGVEFIYMREPVKLDWMKSKIELKNRPTLSSDQKKHILHKLNQATVFEQFLQKKFVGQKRFSIEGGEAIIPALDQLMELGSTLGVKEFVVGMAHRGRLNVLANIFNKTYSAIFSEFEGKEYEDSLFDGDVKYHLGYNCEVVADSGKKIKMTLSPNPSHLETVDPIVEGISRAKIDHKLEGEHEIVPVLIHGDAAVAGQGVVYEVVQMAGLDGYRTGGTVHFVINNQVGFTTNYLDARTSTYCTDVAKTTLCPVFHVNGDDIEAVVQASTIALEYRQKFNQDVFIDLLCYRKYGHNEGDEPKFTQPKLYKAISKHPTPREIYLKKLIEEGVVSADEGKQMKKKFDDMLQDRLTEPKEIEKASITNFLEEDWEGIERARPGDFEKKYDTKFDAKKLKELGKKMSTLPDDKTFFRKVVKLMNDRIKMLEEDSLDWGMGEMLAYASLLDEGHPVRISGQDVERGTFSHRHAVVKTEDTEEEIILLNHLNDKQGKLQIYNSLLSEYGVLGFDYGYAFATPNGLTIWEAQFGDFNNGAQIIIDQYLSSAEEKWNTQNGMVLLLPHGYEGMGPEHSSGRMERYLQLCAEDNMIVANPTTPANYFHLLRRQLKFPFRKPLVVFTPKKLLRYPACVSKLDEMAKGEFQELIADPRKQDKKSIENLVFCSGKVYYDYLEYVEKNGGGESFAIARLEQIFPLPEKQIRDLIASYPNLQNVVWMQEEPENMGAWTFILRSLRDIDWKVTGLQASGSPSAGSSKVFEIRHQNIFERLHELSAVPAK
jgi:2-oxoglutarate dehydrogenase E1 component